MTQIFGSPGRYIQGLGEISRIQKYISWMGDSFLIISDQYGIQNFGESLRRGLGKEFKIVFAEFSGMSTQKEAKRLMDIALAEGCKGIIGMGGGKVIDIAKAIANWLKAPIVVLPTIAASDAATTARSVLYNEDGSLDAEVPCDKNPDIVLVDEEIIMNAPVRFLVSGMGDALSTYLAARTCYQGYKDSCFEANLTETAFAIAKLSYQLVMRHGLLAKMACEQRNMTKDLRKIIETNVLLSGLGCENNGGTSDHSYYYGFCGLTHRKERMLHGEYVTFSSLCMLVLEGAAKEELDEVYNFCLSVGLPVCLEDILLGDMTEDEYIVVAQGVLSEESTHNHPFKVTEREVIASIKTADCLGRLYKTGERLLI